jgi:hypothetical protein
MRIAHTPPVACASCFAQYPDKVHVDFESTWDGPVINNDGTNYSVDDLVICEDCMRAAMALMPSDDESATQKELAELREGYERLLDYQLKLQTGLANIERALRIKPEGLDAELAEAAQPKRRPRPKATA